MSDRGHVQIPTSDYKQGMLCLRKARDISEGEITAPVATRLAVLVRQALKSLDRASPEEDGALSLR